MGKFKVKSPALKSNTGKAWEAEKIGEELVKLKFKIKLPKTTFRKGMKQNFLRRVFDAKNVLKDDKAINRIYRASHKKQDELFSTALTRELIKGVFGQNGNKVFNAAEMDKWNELIDIVSSARIPTEYSGNATMQHPANRAKALFVDPYDTASEHSKLDTERRRYVEAAMQKEVDSGVSDRVVVVTMGVRASIEFTLNYFTAPITASNILRYTRNSGNPLTDSQLQGQIASREKMKILYEELGGVLRTLTKPETQRESWTRLWGINRSAKGEALTVPPSPRRGPIAFYMSWSS